MEIEVNKVKINDLVEYKGRNYIRGNYYREIKKYSLIAFDHYGEEKKLKKGTIVKLL